MAPALSPAAPTGHKKAYSQVEEDPLQPGVAAAGGDGGALPARRTRSRTAAAAEAAPPTLQQAVEAAQATEVQEAAGAELDMPEHVPLHEAVGQVDVQAVAALLAAGEGLEAAIDASDGNEGDDGGAGAPAHAAKVRPGA